MFPFVHFFFWGGGILGAAGLTLSMTYPLTTTKKLSVNTFGAEKDVEYHLMIPVATRKKDHNFTLPPGPSWGEPHPNWKNWLSQTFGWVEVFLGSFSKIFQVPRQSQDLFFQSLLEKELLKRHTF